MDWKVWCDTGKWMPTVGIPEPMILALELRAFNISERTVYVVPLAGDSLFCSGRLHHAATTSYADDLEVRRSPHRGAQQVLEKLLAFRERLT